MISIISVTVMTALNSLVKIDALDTDTNVQDTRFFPASTECDVLNSYIAQMKGETAPVVAAPIAAPRTRKANQPVANQVPVVEVTQAPVVTAAVTPVGVTTTMTPVQETPAPVAPRKAVDDRQIYSATVATPEIKAVISNWIASAAGSPTPKAVIDIIPAIKEGLEGRAILINGQEDVQLRNWVQSYVRSAMAPAADLI